MTNQELIDELSRLPPDSQVVVAVSGQWCRLASAPLREQAAEYHSELGTIKFRIIYPNSVHYALVDTVKPVIVL